MRPDEHEETGDAAALRARLQHVYWIGGGSGAGKSTIARRIAAQHGLHVYSTDEVMPDHASRSTPEDALYLSRFKTMDMDERWGHRSPEIMLETFHWFRGEGFGLIVEDLLRDSAIGRSGALVLHPCRHGGVRIAIPRSIDASVFEWRSWRAWRWSGYVG
jgi:hypothetical protein